MMQKIAVLLVVSSLVACNADAAAADRFYGNIVRRVEGSRVTLSDGKYQCQRDRKTTEQPKCSRLRIAYMSDLGAKVIESVEESPEHYSAMAELYAARAKGCSSGK